MVRLGLGFLLAISLLTTSSTLSSSKDKTKASDQAKPSTDSKSNFLNFQSRVRVETSKGSGKYHQVIKRLSWNPKETAIVICDMWDDHTCPTAAARVAEMAPSMNQVVSIARSKGLLIIHCPSNCMDFYKNTPQRKLAQQAAVVKTKVPLKGWCHLDKKHESALPIDDSDGGCDCEKGIKSKAPWTRQIAIIKIQQGDAITDSAEAFYLMKQRGIKNVIVMGVHTNMCVLGRPFSIRQMIYQGQNVVLMRDMTDTMYNPQRRPFVSHFTGTDLVCDHIEAHWCPTITSSDFTGKPPFRFKNDSRPQIVIINAEDEYKTAQTLPPFAMKHLGKYFRVTFVNGNARRRNDIPGLAALKTADLVILSVRRRPLPKVQMKIIRDYLKSGKPLIGIRTASHAFGLFKGKKPPAGTVSWDTFDGDVLGGNYHNHHSNKDFSKNPTLVRMVQSSAKHPIMQGVAQNEFPVTTSLYMTSPLKSGTNTLMMGRLQGIKQQEPIAWTNSYHGGRIFYTSLGGVGDFKIEAFRRMLFNAVFWTQKMKIPKFNKSPKEIVPVGK